MIWITATAIWPTTSCRWKRAKKLVVMICGLVWRMTGEGWQGQPSLVLILSRAYRYGKIKYSTRKVRDLFSKEVHWSELEYDMDHL